jgi:hypothetical protein
VSVGFRFAAASQSEVAPATKLNNLATAGSRATHIIAAISAACLVISSAGFGAVFAWQTGSEHGPLLGVLSVLMAVALECTKPLALAAALTSLRSLVIVRGLALLLLASVAVVYSLSAELSLMAQNRGDLVAARAAESQAAREARGERERVSAELDAIGVVRSPAELRAKIGPLANGRSGDPCDPHLNPRAQSTCKQLTALRAELGRAERKEKLEAQLEKLGHASGPVSAERPADPGASSLSALLLAVFGIKVQPDTLTLWLPLVAVFALELGSALAALLVQGVSAPAVRKAASTIELKPAEVRSDTLASPDTRAILVSGSKRRRTQSRTSTAVLGQRMLDLLAARGGEVEAGQRAIGKLLGQPKSTVNEILHELAAAGRVRLQVSKQGTRVALVS